MIIDRTYFWGNLDPAWRPTAVGNSAELRTRQDAEVDAYIAKYEDELLTLIFGDLKDAYVAGRASEPWSAVDAFVVNSTTKTSIIANYAFFHYWNDKQYQVDSSGTFVKTREDGTVVSNSVKTIKAWNEMVDKIILLFEFITENLDTYVTGEDEFNYTGWSRFVTYSGGYVTGNYLNAFGI